MDFDINSLKQISLLLFFTFFVGVVVWAFTSRRSRGFDHDAGLPLEEGRPVVPSSAASAEESHNV
jgi:cbb3-type cytochrome oxidase subunit 3